MTGPGRDEETRQTAEVSEEIFGPVLRIEDTDDGLRVFVMNTERSLSGDVQQNVRDHLVEVIADYMAGAVGSSITLIKEGPASPGADNERERPDPGKARSREETARGAATLAHLMAVGGMLAGRRESAARSDFQRGFVRLGHENPSRRANFYPIIENEVPLEGLTEPVLTEEREAGQPDADAPVELDDAYYDEVRKAVGRGTRSGLFGTSTRSLERNLSKLREQRKQQDSS